MPTPGLTEAAMREAVAAVAEHGNISEAARALGMPRGTLQSRLKNARTAGIKPRIRVAAGRPSYIIKGESILTNRIGEEVGKWTKTRLAGRDDADTLQLPDPKKIIRTSRLYDQTGAVTQQWVTEQADAQKREALWQVAAAALTEAIPRIEPITAPNTPNDDLLVAYPVADHHFGMLSWAPETGADYDLEIAEQLLADATRYLIGAAPAASCALVAFLGDMMHYDSFEAVTPRSRNLLDADSRYPKMVATTIRAMRRVIDGALAKHNHVHVIIEIGNHDPSSAVFLAQSFAALYEAEPRVTIDTNPASYHYFRFGGCLIGTHHGHQVKMDSLPGIMARDRARDWGETRHRFWWTGHIHHAKSARTIPNFSDGAGCSVESFRILPPVDAYNAGMGYRSPRDMKSIVLHRMHGEVARHTVTPHMLEGSRA